MLDISSPQEKKNNAISDSIFRTSAFSFHQESIGAKNKCSLNTKLKSENTQIRAQSSEERTQASGCKDGQSKRKVASRLKSDYQNETQMILRRQITMYYEPLRFSEFGFLGLVDCCLSLADQGCQLLIMIKLDFEI